MSDLIIKIKNFKQSLKNNGINTEIRRLINYIKYKKTVLNEYNEWILMNEPNKRELKKQENYKPLTNTKFLILAQDEKLNQLSIKQTYCNYEISYLNSKTIIDIINNTDSDYCIFLGKNIELLPFTLYSILKYVEYNECNCIYCDNDWIIDGERKNPEFKPHFAYDNILSKNYFGNFIIVKTKFLKEHHNEFLNLSNIEPIYDISLRCVGLQQKIMHIDRVLYHKISEDIDYNEQKEIIKNYLTRQNIKFDEVVDGKFKGQYKINYTILEEDKISIIIPNMDHISDLKKCIDSIKKSSYKNYEIIIVENNSKEKETFEFYEKLEQENDFVKVVKMDISEFNFSKIVNFGVMHSSGKYVLLLNNDIEIITPDWLEQMLMYIQRENVGIVGARLYFSDNSIQHAGVTIGIRGLAGHRYRELRKEEFSKYDDVSYVQDLSAVTAACFIVRKKDYEELLGFDEELAVAFNDVDFCLKIRKMKKMIIYNPFIEAYHYESKSRGDDNQNKEKQARFAKEYAIFVKRWSKVINKRDPYFSINYRLDTDIPRINYNRIH